MEGCNYSAVDIPERSIGTIGQRFSEGSVFNALGDVDDKFGSASSL
jgi:hypothetical protein